MTENYYYRKNFLEVVGRLVKDGPMLMELAWRSGRVFDFHTRDPGSIPGLATSRPTQAFVSGR